MKIKKENLDTIKKDLADMFILLDKYENGELNLSDANIPIMMLYMRRCVSSIKFALE